MIALILLILVVVVIGGGVEVVRRMRFGGGAAAAHHRALDTLGQLTNQGADRRVDLAPPAGTPLLDHVRRVVESDPTHPRISPRPISRPVAIPSAVNGGEAAAPAPEEVAVRPTPTEIEGVRILLPDPPPSEAAEVPLDAADDASDDDASDDAAGVDEEVVDEAGVDEAGVDEDEQLPVDAADDTETVDPDETVVTDGDEPVEDESDDGEPAGDADPVDPVPVGPISLADRRPDDANGSDATLSVAGDRHQATGNGADPAGAIAGTPVSPPTSTDGAESVRVLRIDETEPTRSGEGVTVADRPNQVHRVDEPPARTGVATTAPAADLRGGASGPPPGPGDVEGFRILPPADAVSAVADPDASDMVTDQVAVVPAAPAPEDRPWRHSGGAPAVTGTFHPAPPEQTRAQLAALARSGRVEPVSGGGGGGAHRSHNRRSRRAGGHARSNQRPVRHRGLRVATATLAVVVAAVGVVSAVVIANKGSSNPRATHTATPVTAAPAPTTTAPAVPASLVSRTASTATYQVTGSPTINFVGSGSCWIEIRQGDQTGKILFEGVLSTGAQKSQTGPFWVRLGNPAAISVQVNGMTLNQPAGTTGNPYNLQFQ